MWIKGYNNKITGELIYNLLRDIETCDKSYRCCAYPGTIRSILTGNQESPFYALFNKKDYFGILSSTVKKSYVTKMLDYYVKQGIIFKVINETNKKNRYTTFDPNSFDLEEYLDENDDCDIL